LFRDPYKKCEFPACPEEKGEDQTLKEGEDQIFCAQDTQLCPDKITYVSRDPDNNCEFKPCPQKEDVGEDQTLKDGEDQIFCAQDAWLCPDKNTYVSRDPENNCEFKPCPQQEEKGEDQALQEGEDQTYCTEDAWLCPDKITYVSRDPENNCEFKPCPQKGDETPNIPTGEALVYSDEPILDEMGNPSLEGDMVYPETPNDATGLQEEGDEQVVYICTDDKFMCPDGSYVSRDLDLDCEFRACPKLVRSCTEDAKRCPDGTVVSRDPENNCEFPSCRRGGLGSGGGSDNGSLPEDEEAVVAACSNEEKVCDDLSIVHRNPEKCCVFFPCPDEGMLEMLERNVQEMSCEATSVSRVRRPGQ
jgi:hypothetical protein